MGKMSVDLCGITLDNPIIPASGTFGYGYEFAELYDINMLGTFSFKGTTKDARFGNPTPRIAECSSGMINSVGLQNPGVEKVIGEELPKLAKCFSKKVMANVSGFSIDDYVYTCEKLDKCDQVGWIEVNVSCPNVHGGGMSFGTTPEASAQVTRAVKSVTTKPIIIKLSPNVTDIVSIARACEEAGADGISLIPVSGYRSRERQHNNFERKIKYYTGLGYGKAEATRLASEIVLMPGTSEHNAGLAMDFGTNGNYTLDENFAKTDAFKWLSAHAADYGFILRYESDTKHITKITYEPWHWRYVGVKAAKEIKASGVTLEEYLGMA